MERNTAKVKKVILPAIGKATREDKKVFNGFKDKIVYRKRGAKLGVTEKYSTDDKMIGDETLTYIRKRPTRRQRPGVNGRAREDDWRYEAAEICPDRFYQAM